MSESASIQHAVVRTVTREGVTSRVDSLAAELPLEIRIAYGVPGRRASKALSITMRTPGDDNALAVGFLVSEGIVSRREEVEAVHPIGTSGNEVTVELAETVDLDWSRLERHFYTTSSCGICGRASMEAVEATCDYELDPTSPHIDPALIMALPERLRSVQQTFEKTGGLHAAGLFRATGELVRAAEDVGRHNAVDKIVGAALLAGELPLADSVLAVSGRAGFELVQKALMAGIPAMVAIGAPSSLAAELAGRAGMTLVGFARPHQFNVYSGASRVGRFSE